jgi:hypothetical protein
LQHEHALFLAARPHARIYRATHEHERHAGGSKRRRERRGSIFTQIAPVAVHPVSVHPDSVPPVGATSVVEPANGSRCELALSRGALRRQIGIQNGDLDAKGGQTSVTCLKGRVEGAVRETRMLTRASFTLETAAWLLVLSPGLFGHGLRWRGGGWHG